MLAGWRLLRCNPWSHGGVDPVEDQRLFRTARLHDQLPVANVLQPLIDVAESIMRFFHDTVGFGWGLSIIALTVVVRLAILPLTFKQVQSMQALQRLQPEMKKIQERYKDDRQRMNQEMMKLYQEHKVNPLGSCLPLLLQLPFFLALFYMLREDLGSTSAARRRSRAARSTAAATARSSSSSPTSRTGHRRRLVDADRPLRRHPARLGPVIDGHAPTRQQRLIMLALPFVFVTSSSTSRPA